MKMQKAFLVIFLVIIIYGCGSTWPSFSVPDDPKYYYGLGFGESEYELQTALDDLQKIKPLSDLIIVIAHWGNEYQTTINQTLQTMAYSFIDLGADLVIGSHPHVVQPQEVYKNKTIYYSLGNFVYDQYFSPETQKGLLVEVDINSQTKTMFYTNHNLILSLTGQTLLDD